MLFRLVLAMVAAAGIASAQNSEVENGLDLYLYFCAECHGKDAESVGPMAEMLAIKPPMLTSLAERNGGTFPTASVAMQIDGRISLPSHGDMPVFGPYLDSVQSVAIKLQSGQPIIVTQNLADLIAYLQFVQAE